MPPKPPPAVTLSQAKELVRCLADWQAVLARWYAEDLPGCYPDPAIHRGSDCEEAA